MNDKSVANKALQNIALVFLTLCLSGCFEAWYHPWLDVVDGKFITPHGEFLVDTINNLDLSGHDKYRQKKNNDFIILATDNNTFMRMGISKSFVILFDKNKSYEGITHKTYFYKDKSYEFQMQSSNSPPILTRKEFGTVKKSQTIFVTLPKQLARLGGGYNNENLKAAKNDIHRFLISFKLDDEEYTVDVSFKVKYHTQWKMKTWHFPGTP